MTPILILQIHRQARVFTAGPEWVRRLAAKAIVHRLMPGQRFEPDGPCDLVVRQGNVRVGEMLDDGRMVTRAVLQTGMLARITSDTDDAPHTYHLAQLRLTSLTETEVWQLETGEAALPDRPSPL